jgi:FixJ family two-component response regulator
MQSRGIEGGERRRSCSHPFAAGSEREREIMVLVARGLLNKQIAAELGLSEVTVKVHRGNVMRKMQAPTLADLVRISDRLSSSPVLGTLADTKV